MSARHLDTDPDMGLGLDAGGRARGDALLGAFWLGAGALALGCAAWAQYVRGMVPCQLCLWERWPYRALVVVGLAWLLLSVSGRAPRRALAAAVAVALLAAMGVAGLHVGVEQGWWPDPVPACAAPRFAGGSIAQRLASMPLRPAKPCDAPNRLFEWLPVSMTLLDFLYAGALLVGGLWLLPGTIGARRWMR